MHVRHAEEWIIPPAVPEGAATAEVLAEVLRGFAVRLETDERALADEGPGHRLHTVVVEPDTADATVVLARGDVEVLAAVLQLPDVAQLHEARARVIRFVSNDSVDLGRVRDDLVNRQHRMGRPE